MIEKDTITVMIPHMTPHLECQLERVFCLAVGCDLELDFHGDENLGSDARCLLVIVETALR